MLKPIPYNEPTQLDEIVFERMVPANHYLRRVRAAIDFEFVREAVADAYSPSMGRGAECPVRMLKLVFLQYQYDLSDVAVIDAARVNIAFRYFLCLSMQSAVPSPSLLSDFRLRLGAARFGQIFDRIVGQARALGFVKDRLRLKDATHVVANVAIPSTIALVAQMRVALLTCVGAVAPDVVAHHEAEAEVIRVASSDLKGAQRLLVRVEHVRRIVEEAEAIVEKARASGVEGANDDEALEALERAIAQAHKVLGDREEGAKDKVVSLVDVEVRTGKHGDWYDGYMLDVLVDADSEVMTGIDVLAANADEAANTVAMIKGEEEAHGNDIEAVSIDSIGYQGKVLEALIDDEDGPQMAVFVPPYKRGGAKEGCFGAEAFALDEATGTLRCPAGQETTSRTYTKARSGYTYYYRKSQCGTCPLRDHCLGPGSTVSRRTVAKSDYEMAYTRAQEVAQSEPYRQARRQHPRVERKIADLIRNHGGRRVRYRGRARVRIQYYATAMVVNIKRLVNHLIPSLQAQTV